MGGAIGELSNSGAMPLGHLGGAPRFSNDWNTLPHDESLRWTLTGTGPARPTPSALAGPRPALVSGLTPLGLPLRGETP